MAYNPKTGKGLGRFYSAEHRAFRAREWRGFRDTFYDFFRWLYLYGFMAAKLGCHPILMVKAMLRYRWMVSYLTAAHMVDRHTMGLRGKELRYAHNQFFSVLHNSVLGVRDIILRDKNLRPNSKHAAKLRENTVMFDEMTPHLIMMGFPTVKWIDIAMFAIGLPSEVDQNASMFYIDAMEHLGLPADVCPEPAAESGAPWWTTIRASASATSPARCRATARSRRQTSSRGTSRSFPRSRSRRRSVSTNRKYRPMRSRT